jgi:release factor glutamine methyltransferase
VAIALALARPRVSVVACDASDAALAIARINAARHGAQVKLVQSDWFSALREERFHAVLANPPYVASGDPHLERGDLRFEPRAALEAGPTGLEQIRAIAREAIGHFVAGGWIALEHGHDQGAACECLLHQAGYREIKDVPDLAAIPRVITGRFDHAGPGR